MAFKKGKSGNPKGRTPGSKDKAKKDIKESFQSLVECNLSNINIWLNAVAVDNPAKALDLMLKLSEFILPKMRATELKTDIEPTQNNSVLEALYQLSNRNIPEGQPDILKSLTEKFLSQEQSSGYLPEGLALRD